MILEMDFFDAKDLNHLLWLIELLFDNEESESALFNYQVEMGVAENVKSLLFLSGLLGFFDRLFNRFDGL
jgi:hypothetical protein